ncbi:MAG: tape measure protein [Oscillibacter sp.]|nr:tape measure protein [Oscillibacter sp.]
MPETSIVVKIDDRYSSVLKSMSDVTKAFDKNAEHLEKTLHDLSGEKSILQAETNKARKAMLDAQKQFAATGDEADALRASLAGQEYEDYRRKMETINKTMKETEKQIRSVSGAAKNSGEAMKNSGGGMGGFGQKGGLSLAQEGSVWMFLSRSGTGKMLGEALSNMGGALVGSALGDAGGSMVSSIGSGIAAGAAGGMIFGLPGAALGGIIGGATGFINGDTQIKQAEDNAFKDYYRGLYESANTGTVERLASGSALASGRETTALPFNTLLGDGEKAGAFLGQLQDTANTTPFLYDDLVDISKTMLSFGTAAEDIIPTLTKVGDAGAALGLSTGDIGTVATYLGRMQSSGKATLEYLNPLNERGFSVFQWLADDQGASVGDVYSQISKGELSGSYVSEVILSQFEKLYGGMMDIQSKSTAGLDSTLQGLKENVDAAGGERYNEARKASKEADIAAYGGALGDKLAELSAIGGEVQAYGENLQDQYQREALEAVLTGTLDKASTVFSQEDAGKLEELSRQYSEANQAYENGSLEAGQKMLDLKEEAEALAAAAYESSGWYQALQEAETEEIAAIRELTAGMDACTNALRISNEFSKGGASAWFGWWKGGGEEGPKAETGTAASYLTGAKKEEKPYRYNAYLGYAYGLEYVPFDNYPALLHQGERVLTAAEARGMDRGVLPGAGALGEDKKPSLEGWAAGRFAFGLKGAPYGNYPALLHQGERVLTAAEAWRMERGVLPAARALGEDKKLSPEDGAAGRFAFGLKDDNSPALPGVPAMGDPAWGPWETAAGRFPSGGALADRALGGSPAPQEEALRPLAGNPVPLEEALWGPRKIGDFVGRGERNEAGGVPASGGDGADGISLWGPRKIGDFVGRGERNGAGGGLAGGGDGAERNFVGRRCGDTHLMVHVEAINVRGSAEPDFVDEIAEALLEKIRLAGLRGGG